ncbi:MAG: TIGR02757 family protein [Proteobacteria bacterium]|nr:TIGR02757 family protein [Pseudomonadota bacterium]
MNALAREKIVRELYERFHDPRYLEWDPLGVVRGFAGSPDQEYLALISALFAFGGVKQIIASIRNAVERLDLEPGAGRIRELGEIELAERLRGFVHRIYVDRDLIAITMLHQRSVLVYGSMKAHFLVHHDSSAETIERGLAGLIRDYKIWAEALELKGPHFKHMLNSPEDGSTCKRWLMLLKWLIRADDGIDLGLWTGTPGLTPAQLLIPLDTHLFKISRTLNLTRKKTANWATAVEVTRNLKKLDPLDPVKYDFSLCRYGMFDYRGML